MDDKMSEIYKNLQDMTEEELIQLNVWIEETLGIQESSEAPRQNK